MSKPEPPDRWRWTLAIFAVANLGNAAWMLADPAGWYANLPAAVPDTGPLNLHFVRDIGSTFGVMGGVLAWAAVRRRARVGVLMAVSAFYVLHGLVHVTDTLAGRLPPSHWMIDAPGVYLPALLLLGVTVAVQRSEPAA